MRKLRVAFGGRSLGYIQRQAAGTWESFCQRYLSEFERTNVTTAEYHTLSREERGRYKGQAGWFVGGWFDGRRRRRDTLGGRSMVCLDVDHLDADDLFDLELAYHDTACVIYATHSFTPEAPRVRIVFPLARDVTYDEYQPIARRLAERAGLDLFDDTTFEEVRLMYRPCVPHDLEPPFLKTIEGSWADPDTLLESYKDWHDWGEWPTSTRAASLRRTARKAEDPRDKPGAIGAFCRTFDIHTCIARWLGDHFEPTEIDSRYRPVDSEGGAPGAIVYDDGLFLYSHHEHGPTAGRNVNAWDLVRLCLFGETDWLADDETPIGELPSQRAMLAWVAELPEIQRVLVESEFTDTDDEAIKAGSEPTYDSILELLEAKDDGSGDREFAHSILSKMVSAPLTEIDTNHLLGVLRRKDYRNPSKADLRVELDRTRRSLRGESTFVDSELMLIEEFEQEWYPDGTLKRIGRRYWSFELGLWAIVSDEIVTGKVVRTIERLRKERPEEAEKLITAVGETKTSTLARALGDLVASRLAQRETRDDPLQLMRHMPLPVVNCRNVEVHVDYEGKRRVRRHDPSHFFTTRIDTRYNPDALCPLFDDFLAHAFARADDPEGLITFVYELGGYIIGASRWLKLWVMLHGPTNTGKSTLAEVYTRLLGGAAAERKLSSLDSRQGSHFKDVGLVGKLLFVDDDLDKGLWLPDGDIKRISEEKIIQTEVKYGDDLRFVCRAFPLVCTNHWPRTNDLTDAFLDRTIIIPFRNPYDELTASDATKQKMIATELPGILNRFLEGLSHLRRRGYLELPADILRAREDWLLLANPVSAFRYTVLEQKVGAPFVKASTMHEWYLDWHRQESQSSRPLPRNEFYSRLEALIGPRKTRQGYQGWTDYQRAPDREREEREREWDDFDYLE